MKKYDIIIIGMGCAGIGTYLQAVKSTGKILAIEKSEIGGSIVYAERVTNMPFLRNASGRDCVRLFKKQIGDKMKILQEECLQIKECKDSVIVFTTNKSFRGRYAVVCTGRNFKKLNKHNIKLKTIHENPDNENVCIIGGGEIAVDRAVFLKRKKINVDIISTGYFKNVNSELMRRAEKMKINFFCGSSVKNIKEAESLTVRFLKENKMVSKSYSDVFVCIGTKANLPEIIRKNSRIVYAGTVRDSLKRQCSIAFADGVKRAMEIEEKMRREDENS